MNSLVWMSEEKRAEYDWLKHEQEESKKEKGKAKGKIKSKLHAKGRCQRSEQQPAGPFWSSR